MRPGAWTREARDEAEEGGLARAVGPDQREHLAGGNREVDPVQRDVAAELHAHARGGNHRGRDAHGWSVGARGGTSATTTSAGWPGTRGAFHPASRSTFAP